MHKIKLLSQRTKAEVEAKNLMIENSKIGHNQEIDLSSRKLENASIVGKWSLKRDCWHWNKEQNKGKYEKNDSEKNTTAVVIAEDVVLLSIEEQKCEHVANNDVEWVVDSAASHHVIPTKKLFTTYKVEKFGTVKLGNFSYSKIVEIGDVCIKTNIGSAVMLEVVRHVVDRSGYCNYLGNGKWKLTKESWGHWLLQEDMHVAVCTRLM